MAISLKPDHLKRYGDFARLLVKYGRGDLIRGSGLEGIELEEPAGNGRSHAGGAVARGKSKRGAPAAVPGRESAGGPPTETEKVAAKASELADDLEKLGPTFIKIGQFLSTRADLLPLPYLEALARLQDNIGPFPFADVERIVSEELGVRLSKAFSYFEDVPVAAASLGQVHRAELRSGMTVAVKVQRPGVRELILRDLEALGEIASFLDEHTEVGRRYAFSGMLEEFRRSLLRELDYRQEARNLSLLGRNLMGFDRIVVPRPVEDYLTPRVLTMEFIEGRKVTALSPLARLEVDGRPLAEMLTEAYLKQILVDGMFHADPHPGNVFITDDGRLALLDLGMVGHMGPALQEKLLKLLLAISEGRGEDAGALAAQLGEPQATFDEKGVRQAVSDLVVRTQGLRLQDVQVGRIMFEIARIAADGGVRVPRELTMLGKTLMNIDLVARKLDPELDVNALIQRNAAEIMRTRMMKSLSPGRLFASVLEVKEFAEKLPARVNSLIDALVENRVRIKVDAIDQVLLMEGLQKIANRITTGLLTAALIIGAAMLMRIDTRIRLFGYPLLAMVFFLFAAITAVGLIADIVVNDLRGRRERVLRLTGSENSRLRKRQ